MTGTSRPDTVPHALSTFVGRGREVEEVHRLLATARWVTLTGPGGCGKTRLALKVAEDLISQVPNGVGWIELAPLANPELVPQAVAAALDVRSQPGADVTDALARHLGSRSYLLILDNCEHLLDGCAGLVAALLSRCRSLRILATSREPLAVSGETIWNVPPLTLPQSQLGRGPEPAGSALTILEESEAVQLFVARSTAISPDFSLTVHNSPWIADICRQLDGMPLAIELAAARTRVLSARQIAERLHDRFSLLTGGSRTAPPRHQTLAATLDWSHALLSPLEQAILRRLSVISGGCTLEAAEAICGAEGVDPAVVLDGLARLMDKSLLLGDQLEGGTRYRLLETIRQYAYGRLIEAGEEATTRDRHLGHYLEWAESAEPHLNGSEQLTWLARYEVEHDNLRAALDWSRTASRAVPGLRLAAACGRFWRIHAYVSEGRSYLTDALSDPESRTHRLPRARALTFLANLAYLQSDYPAMRPVAEESVAIWRELGPGGLSGLAYTLDLLGELATEEGDYARAPEYFEESLHIYRALGDVRGMSDILLQFGWAAMRVGQYAQATTYLDETLALAQSVDHFANIAFACSGLGEAAIRQGDYARAADLLELSLARNRSRGDRWEAATVLGSLGWVALCQNDFGRMKAYLKDSLTERLAYQDRGGIAWCLEKLALASWRLGEAAPPAARAVHFRRAAGALGSAAAIRAGVRSVIDPVDQPELASLSAGLRRALGDAAFEQAAATGQALSIERAIDEALALPDTSDRSAKGPHGKGLRLTAREREVSRLVAQGKTNREIAQAMMIGVKTVETYITRILNKLGLGSRVHLALWERDQESGSNSQHP